MNARLETGWQERPRYSSQRGKLLNHLSLVGVVGGAALLAYAYLAGGGASAGLSAGARLWTLAPLIGSWLIVSVVWLWRGLGYWPRASLLLFSGYVVAVVLFARQGLSGSGRLWLTILPALVFVFMGSRFGGFAALLSALVYAALTVLVSQGWSPSDSVYPARAGHWISEGGGSLILMTALILILRSFDRGWARALREADAAQKQLGAGREKLVTLTKQLRRKSSQLETAAGVAQAGASTLDLDMLLDEIVDTMLDGLDSIGADYVGCFLLGESGDTAVLKAGASKIGEPPLEKGDRLSVDRRSAVGSAIADEEVQVVAKVDESTRGAEGAEDQTRSEIALPLLSGGRTLGAISVLSARDVQELTAGDDDIDRLQAIVDQVAVAVQNAQLFGQTQAALAELEAVQRRYSAEEWTEFLSERSDLAVDYTAPGVEARDDGSLREARRLAVEENRPVAMDSAPSGESDQTEGALVVPLRLRGRPVGTMTLHETRRRPVWTDEDVALAETVAQEVAQTVENLRLIDESRQRLAREQLVGDVAARMRESLDVESVLRTGAVGIREAMGLPAVTVRLTGSEMSERAE